MDIMQKARDAIALIQQGREMIAGIKDAVEDGRAAVNATQADELDALLAIEHDETKAAFNSMQQAIAASRT